MRALVIGYGSIGSRHTRILTEIGCNVAVVSKRKIEYPICYKSITEALAKHQPEYVIISNSTTEHYQSLLVLNQNQFEGRILIEKPIFNEVREIFLKEKFSLSVFVAYNLRFHPIIQRIRYILNKQCVISANVYVGQYLPDWRPGFDYRCSYSASVQGGGGVLRDLSHELDYLNWLFGGWQRLTAIGGKYSSLEIDSDDTFAILGAFNQCPIVTIQMNYLDWHTRRELVINTNECTIKADLINCILQVNGDVEQYQSERDMTYREQHLSIIKGDFSDLCSLTQGMEVVYMIQEIERAANENRWVQR